MRRLTEDVAREANGVEGNSIFELSHQLEELTLSEAAKLSAAIPKLCALVVFSPFDIALFDAWGKANGSNAFASLARPLKEVISLAGSMRTFEATDCSRYVRTSPVATLPLFHLVADSIH